MSKKTFLYIRVSTLDQVNGAESQARALLEWCTRNNITEYETFTDQGISGAKESRPALDKMMDRVKRLEADQVIVFAFSRFARSTMHLLKGLQIFKDCKTRFVSITEQIDTESSMGIAMFTLSGQKTTKKQCRNDLRVIRRLREIIKSDQFWRGFQDSEYSL